MQIIERESGGRDFLILKYQLHIFIYLSQFLSNKDIKMGLWPKKKQQIEDTQEIEVGIKTRLNNMNIINIFAKNAEHIDEWIQKYKINESFISEEELIEQIIKNENFNKLEKIIKNMNSKIKLSQLSYSTNTSIYIHLIEYYYTNAKNALSQENIQKNKFRHILETIHNSANCYAKVKDSDKPKIELKSIELLYGDYYFELSKKGSNLENKKKHLNKALEIYKNLNEEDKIKMTYNKLAKIAVKEYHLRKADELYRLAGRESNLVETSKSDPMHIMIQKALIKKEEEEIENHLNNKDVIKRDDLPDYFNKAQKLIKMSNISNEKKYKFSRRFAFHARDKYLYDTRQTFIDMASKYES